MLLSGFTASAITVLRRRVNVKTIARNNDVIFIQVTLNAGRTVELKQAFYKAVADGLHERLGLRHIANICKCRPPEGCA